MTLDELADSVNAAANYRKRDGSQMQSGQIHLRTRAGGSYEHLFERDGKRVRLRNRARLPVRTRPRRSAAAPEGETSGSRRSAAIDLEAVTQALDQPRHAIPAAAQSVPDAPGLYAIYGGGDVWKELGLGDPPDDRPLYVGKAERSLLARDLRQHFASGRTGSSTVRRTFAALLRESLDLSGVPRNPRNPERFENYGLTPPDDAKLTDWMHGKLTIAVWPAPLGTLLVPIERTVVSEWLPPLNLQGVSTQWKPAIMAARRAMAQQARKEAYGD